MKNPLTNIIVKRIANVLSTVIKDFSRDQIDISLLNGKVELDDFEINTEIVDDYLLYYTGFLQLDQIKVSSLRIKIPGWTNLKSKPVLVSVGNVDVRLSQRPDEHRGITPELPQFDDTGGSYGFTEKVIDGVRIEIESLRIRLRLNGFPVDVGNVRMQKTPLDCELLCFQTIICSCNDEYKVEDLKKIRKGMNTKKDFNVHKLIVCKHANLFLSPRGDCKDPATVFMQDQFFQIGVLLQKEGVTGALKRIGIDLEFGDLNLKVDPRQWVGLNYWVNSLLRAIAISNEDMEVPELEGKEVPLEKLHLTAGKHLFNHSTLCASPSLMDVKFTSTCLRFRSIQIDVTENVDPKQPSSTPKATLVQVAAQSVSVAVLTPDEGQSIWRDEVANNTCEQVLSLQINGVQIKAHPQLRDAMYTGEEKFSIVPSDHLVTVLESAEQTTMMNNENFIMTLDRPFPGWRSGPLCFLNLQQTTRWPQPKECLGQITDLHIKPLKVILDVWLYKNTTFLLIGNNVLEFYKSQLMLTSSEDVTCDTCTRLQIDSVRCIIPIIEDVEVLLTTQQIRLASHPNLNSTLPERGLILLRSQRADPNAFIPHDDSTHSWELSILNLVLSCRDKNSKFNQNSGKLENARFRIHREMNEWMFCFRCLEANGHLDLLIVRRLIEIGIDVTTKDGCTSVRSGMVSPDKNVSEEEVDDFQRQRRNARSIIPNNATPTPLPREIPSHDEPKDDIKLSEKVSSVRFQSEPVIMMKVDSETSVDDVIEEDVKAADENTDLFLTLSELIPDCLLWSNVAHTSFVLKDEGYTVYDYDALAGNVMLAHSKTEWTDFFHGQFENLRVNKSPLGKFEKESVELKIAQKDIEHWWFEFSPLSENQMVSRKLATSLLSAIENVDRDRSEDDVIGKGLYHEGGLEYQLLRTVGENRGLRQRAEQLNTQLNNELEKRAQMVRDHLEERERIVETLQGTSIRLHDELNMQREEIRTLQDNVLEKDQLIRQMERQIQQLSRSQKKKSYW